MEGTPAEQAQQLKAEYEKKLSEIKENQAESEQIPAEHEAVSKVTEEMIQKQIPDFSASSHAPHDSNDIPPESQAKVHEWINVAITNPSAGVKMAKDSGDISLIDIFHKALTSDAFYQELVKRGEIPELK